MIQQLVPQDALTTKSTCIFSLESALGGLCLKNTVRTATNYLNPILSWNNMDCAQHGGGWVGELCIASCVGCIVAPLVDSSCARTLLPKMLLLLSRKQMKAFIVEKQKSAARERTDLIFSGAMLFSISRRTMSVSRIIRHILILTRKGYQHVAENGFGTSKHGKRNL